MFDMLELFLIYLLNTLIFASQETLRSLFEDDKWCG